MKLISTKVLLVEINSDWVMIYYVYIKQHSCLCISLNHYENILLQQDCLAASIVFIMPCQMQEIVAHSFSP